MNTKPHFRVIAGRPVSVNLENPRLETARRRFGRKFAHELGSTWQPRDTPVLSAWMAGRIKERG